MILLDVSDRVPELNDENSLIQKADIKEAQKMITDMKRLSNLNGNSGEIIMIDPCGSRKVSEKGLNKLLIKKDSFKSVDNFAGELFKRNSKSSSEFKTVHLSRKLKRQLTGNKSALKVQMHNRNKSSLSELAVQEEDEIMSKQPTSENVTVCGELDDRDKDNNDCKKSRFSLNTDSILKLEAFQQKYSLNNANPGSKRNSLVKNVSALKKDFLDSNGLLDFTYEMTNKMLELESVISKLKDGIKAHKQHNSKLMSELQDLKSKHLVALSDIEVLKLKEMNDGAYIEELNMEREEIERLKQEITNVELQLEEKISYIKFQEKKSITDKQELLDKIETLNVKAAEVSIVEQENKLLKKNMAQSFRISSNDEIGYLNQQLADQKREIEELKKEKQKLQRKAEVHSIEFVKKEDALKELVKENNKMKVELTKQKETKEATDRNRKNSFDFMNEEGKEKPIKEKTENLISLKDTLIAHKRFSVKNLDMFSNFNPKEKDSKARSNKKHQTVKQMKFKNANLLVDTQLENNQYICENITENSASKNVTTTLNNENELYFQQSSRRSSNSSSNSMSRSRRSGATTLRKTSHIIEINSNDEPIQEDGNYESPLIKIRGNSIHRISKDNCNSKDDIISVKEDMFNKSDEHENINDLSINLEDTMIHQKHNSANSKLGQYLSPNFRKVKINPVVTFSGNLSNFADENLKKHFQTQSEDKAILIEAGSDNNEEKAAMSDKIAMLTDELKSKQELESSSLQKIEYLERDLKKIKAQLSESTNKCEIQLHQIMDLEKEKEKIAHNLQQSKDLIKQLLADKQNIVSAQQEFITKTQVEQHKLTLVNEDLTNILSSKIVELKRLSLNSFSSGNCITAAEVQTTTIADKCGNCSKFEEEKSRLISEIAELRITAEQDRNNYKNRIIEHEGKIAGLEEKHKKEKLIFCNDYDNMTNSLYELSTKFKILQKEFVSRTLSS